MTELEGEERFEQASYEPKAVIVKPNAIASPNTLQLQIVQPAS